MSSLHYGPNWDAAGIADEALEELASGEVAAAQPDAAAIDGDALPKFPSYVFPLWWGSWVEAEAEATQTPPELGGILSLAAVAAALQKRHVVEVRPGWVEPLGLYTAAILAPAERKSAVMRDATAPLRAWEAAEMERMGPEVAAAHSRKRVLERRLDRAERDAANEKGTQEAAEELAKELLLSPVPAFPRLVVDDVTPERLGALLAEQGGRVAALSAEASILDTVGRYQQGGPADLTVLLQGHAGDELRTDRVGRQVGVVRSPALTIALCAQPSYLAGLGDRPGFRDRGLLARFLYALPASRVGSRSIESPVVPASAAAEYAQGLRALCDLPIRRDGPAGEIESDVLRLSSEARAALYEFAAKIESRLGPAGDLHHIADWAGKLTGAVARIAGLIALARDPGLIPERIEPEHVRRAICVGEWAIPHALAAFALVSRGDRASRKQRNLIEWVHRRGGETSAREVQRHLKAYPTVAAAEAALWALAADGHGGRETRKPGKQGGRPVLLYVAKDRS